MGCPFCKSGVGWNACRCAGAIYATRHGLAAARERFPVYRAPEIVGNYIVKSRYGLIPIVISILFVGLGLSCSRSASASMSLSFSARTNALAASLVPCVAVVSTPICTEVSTPTIIGEGVVWSKHQPAPINAVAIRFAIPNDSLFSQYGSTSNACPEKWLSLERISAICSSESERAVSRRSSIIIFDCCAVLTRSSTTNNNIVHNDSNGTPTIKNHNANWRVVSANLGLSNKIPAPTAIPASVPNGTSPRWSQTGSSDPAQTALKYAYGSAIIAWVIALILAVIKIIKNIVATFK